MNQKIQFVKMTGSGNDFILIDARKGIIDLKDMPVLARALCRRRISVGADGIIFLLEDSDPQINFAWRFYNSDGSEAAFCGNGGRCAARFAIDNGFAQGPKVVFRTGAGIVYALLEGRFVKIQMPMPEGYQRDIRLKDNEIYKGSIAYIKVGVPHALVELKSYEELMKFDVKKAGAFVRSHSTFGSEGANVNFFTVLEDNTVANRTFERGVESETLACGTGAVSVASHLVLSGRLSSPVKIIPMGASPLEVFLDVESAKINQALLRGDAKIVYRGEILHDALENSTLIKIVD